MGKRRFGKQFQRWIIIYRFPAENSAVSMAGVFAQTDIRHYIQLRIFLFNYPDSLLNNAVVIICTGSQCILMRWQAEQQNAANACLYNWFYQLWQLIGAAPFLPVQ
jgi:hypothetical protein